MFAPLNILHCPPPLGNRTKSGAIPVGCMVYISMQVAMSFFALLGFFPGSSGASLITIFARTVVFTGRGATVATLGGLHEGRDRHAWDERVRRTHAPTSATERFLQPPWLAT